MSKTKNGKRILQVTIKRMIDEDPDTSWLGEYSKRATSEFSIDRAHSEDCIENDTIQKEKLERIADAIENDKPICEHDYTEENCEACQEEKLYALVADATRELAECDCNGGDMQRHEYRYFNPSFNYIDKNGRALPENTPEEVRKYVRQDYERMESLNAGNWCFIGIRAHARIWNAQTQVTQDISSGGLWGIESDGGKEHIEETEKEELAGLRTELLSLGFSSRAISTAFKNVERKDA